MQLLKDINYRKMITNRIIVTAIMVIMEFALLISLMARVIRHSALILNIFYVIGFLYVVYLMCKDENASYRTGWLLIILVLPPFGTLLYMLWGDKKPSRKLSAKLEEAYKESERFLDVGEAAYQELEKDSPRMAATARYLKKTSHYPLYQNTHVTYYPVGEVLLEAMLAEMEKAKHFIFLEFFIVEEGEMWGRMLEVLLRKAKEGVEIRMLYDDMGSVALLPFGYSRKLEEMDPHIKCIPFNPVVPFLAMVMNNRDHRKILVVDGHTGFTGGVNLADEYINVKKRYGHWKDTGIRLMGDGVWSLTVMFMEMWNACSKDKLSYEQQRIHLQSYKNEEICEGFVLPFGDNPLDNESVGEDTYMEIINQAKKYVYIITPYLILDDEMRRALVMAAKRGVDVRILTPGIPDKKIVFRLTRANYLPLLKAGVKIYEYTPGFVHAKSFVSDDRVGVVGTINLDYRSLFLHFECGVWMYKVPALADLKRDTLEAIQQSHRMFEEDVHARGWGRLFDGMLRIMAPLM